MYKAAEVAAGRVGSVAMRIVIRALIPDPIDMLRKAIVFLYMHLVIMLLIRGFSLVVKESE